MSIEVGNFPEDDQQDSYLNMVIRRLINESYAEEPVDFNIEGLNQATKHTSLGSDDVILDIGTSSGAFVLAAAKAVGTEAYIIGLEPYQHTQDYLSTDTDTSRFTLIEGYGENIPLPDNSVKMVTAHNVLFRAKDIPQMLAEMKRVTEPGGLLAISTNSVSHAFWRHTFERVVAEIVSEDLSRPVQPPKIPAEDCYLEQLPDILEAAGDLQIIDKVVQRSKVIITKDRLASYEYSIMLSANLTNLPPSLREYWRKTVHRVVEPFVSNVIDNMKEVAKFQGTDQEPYFADTIHRGMVIVRNQKP